MNIKAWALFAAVVAWLAQGAAAYTFNGYVGGSYVFHDEDVHFSGDIYLISNLSVTVYNGNIYVDCNFIDGEGNSGSSGQSGYYEETFPYTEHLPEPGGHGSAGYSLTLRDYLKSVKRHNRRYQMSAHASCSIAR